VPLWGRRQPEPQPEPDLRLVVGLGNPGPRYAETRHNVGYMVVEEIARRGGASFRSSKFRADTARVQVDGMPLLLALPVTYMNESGNAVSRLVQYFHVPLEHLLVVADDMDIPFGTLRLRRGGSSGGNRGMRSVIQSLGSEEFARVRVGIGRPTGSAVGHVLDRFPPEQRQVLPRIVGRAADAVVFALRDGITSAMNEYNRDWLDDGATPSSADE